MPVYGVGGQPALPITPVDSGIFILNSVGALSVGIVSPGGVICEAEITKSGVAQPKLDSDEWPVEVMHHGPVPLRPGVMPGLMVRPLIVAVSPAAHVACVALLDSEGMICEGTRV